VLTDADFLVQRTVTHFAVLELALTLWIFEAYNRVFEC